MTKDSEGTWLSPPRLSDKRWSAQRIIFPKRAGREEGDILTGQMERSRVRFEVLAGGEADLVKLLSLSSYEMSGVLLLWPWRSTPEVPPFPAIQNSNEQRLGIRAIIS